MRHAGTTLQRLHGGFFQCRSFVEQNASHLFFLSGPRRVVDLLLATLQAPRACSGVGVAWRPKPAPLRPMSEESLVANEPKPKTSPLYECRPLMDQTHGMDAFRRVCVGVCSYTSTHPDTTWNTPRDRPQKRKHNYIKLTNSHAVLLCFRISRLPFLFRPAEKQNMVCLARGASMSRASRYAWVSSKRLKASGLSKPVARRYAKSSWHDGRNERSGSLRAWARFPSPP